MVQRRLWYWIFFFQWRTKGHSTAHYTPRGCVVRSGSKRTPGNWAPTTRRACAQYVFHLILCNCKWVPSHGRGSRLKGKSLLPVISQLMRTKGRLQERSSRAAFRGSCQVWCMLLKGRAEIISLLREKPSLSPRRPLLHGPRKATSHPPHRYSPAGPPSLGLNSASQGGGVPQSDQIIGVTGEPTLTCGKNSQVRRVVC